MHRLVGTDRPQTPKRPGALRLVDAGTLHGRHAPAQADRLDSGGAHASAIIEPADPRWVLAVEVARNIQGGRAAILTPERRARTMTFARQLGLRPFDASLVIAIIQDSARTGARSLGAGMPPDVQSRLSLVGGAQPIEPETAHWPVVLGAGVLAVAIFSALVAWVSV